MAPEQAERLEQERIRAAAMAVINELDDELTRRVSARDRIEKRWLEDLRQYHAEPEPAEKARLSQAKRSSAFLNLTQARTSALEARLFDMMYPTDDKNWSIEPTPDPDLDVEAERAVEEARKARQQAGDNPDDSAAAARYSELEQASNDLHARLDEARGRARAMEREMEDQLVQTDWNAESRNAIHDYCKLGICVMRGPITGSKLRQRWQTSEDGTAILIEGTDPSPRYWREDPWKVFPDPDARQPDDGEGVFIRDMLNAKQLRRLAKLDGFDADAVRRVLRSPADHALPGNMETLKQITGDTTNMTGRWLVKEYEGPLDAEHMGALATFLGDDDVLADMVDLDELAEVHAVVTWCNNEVLRFAIHPLDTGEARYSVAQLWADETGPYGYGIPRVMRDVQALLNGYFRMSTDNMGHASGPQVVLDPEQIQPAGTGASWVPEPWKIWMLTRMAHNANASAVPPFQFVQPDANLQQILPMIELLFRFVDEVTGLYQQLNGEPGATPQQTATGTALLMSSANVVFRRFVKNLDDDLIVPSIRRLYTWNMQHSPKAHIKGDYEVKARGSSALMARELNTQNLLAMMQIFGNDDPDIKVDEAKKEVIRSLRLDADQFVRSPEERDQFLKEQAERAGEDPALAVEREKIEAQNRKTDAEIAVAEMKADADLQVAATKHETAMMELAETMNMKFEELRAMMAKTRSEIASDERKLATEVAVQEKQAQQPDEMAGSGGGGSV
jgi:hypothetical protein